MYSVVILVAATSGGDMSGFGRHTDGAGCYGTTVMSGCSGSCHGCCGGGFLGMRSGGGLFSGHKSGCHGAHTTGCTGCSGSIIVQSPPVVTTPVVVAPTGCTGSMYMGGCSGSCHGGGFLGLRSGGGLFGKHKGGCCGGCSGW